MTDNISTKRRSQIMASIGQKDTNVEKFVRSYLHRAGLRFSLHSRNLPGKPDIVLRKYNCIIFVHGCFWHGHKSPECKLARIPKSNVEFWTEKVAKNSARDKKNVQDLLKLGWRVLIVWECQREDVELMKLIIAAIKNPDLVLSDLDSEATKYYGIS